MRLMRRHPDFYEQSQLWIDHQKPWLDNLHLSENFVAVGRARMNARLRAEKEVRVSRLVNQVSTYLSALSISLPRTNIAITNHTMSVPNISEIPSVVIEPQTLYCVVPDLSELSYLERDYR